MYQSVKTWIKAHPVTSILIVLAIASLALLNTCAKAADVIAIKPIAVATIASSTVDATAGYTNSTTSYTDITGASVAVPATNKAWSGKQFIRVCYSADVIKATATIGTIGVYVNGAVVAASERSAPSTLRGNINACYVVARASAAAQTVKLQGKSGDANQFTVTNLQMTVDVLYQN